MVFKSVFHWEKVNLDRCSYVGNNIFYTRHQDTGFIVALKRIDKSKVK